MIINISVTHVQCVCIINSYSKSMNDFFCLAEYNVLACVFVDCDRINLDILIYYYYIKVLYFYRFWLPGLDMIASVLVKRAFLARFDPFQRIFRTSKVGLGRKGKQWISGNNRTIFFRRRRRHLVQSLVSFVSSQTQQIRHRSQLSHAQHWSMIVFSICECAAPWPANWICG